ncbi:unnamed protein product [Macrosiphum euphorbiae]|uniref:Uncharacterized protein n=1 Tax=Macrosiphum euphorbiae TaxID=13131 RepID=A0AAV0X5C1_9HEMI|nr:unnamed protein product [Macrosiphum euphorbiae]
MAGRPTAESQLPNIAVEFSSADVEETEEQTTVSFGAACWFLSMRRNKFTGSNRRNANRPNPANAGGRSRKGPKDFSKGYCVAAVRKSGENCMYLLN